MWKFISIIITVILTSFYFFPFEFVFLPGINTKMVMAGIGLLGVGLNLPRRQTPLIDKDFVVLSIIALVISLISQISMCYNNTNDNSFVTYFISMWVWLSGAYCLYLWLKKNYTNVTIELVCHYLIIVCVGQCILAYSMDIFPPIKDFVDGFLGGDDAFMGVAEGRLYGIGAALDVAGFRFAAVLVMISYISMNANGKLTNIRALTYIISFLLIAVLGCMIGRSTMIGIFVSLAYFLYCLVTKFKKVDENLIRFWKWSVLVFLVFVPLVVILYNTNGAFRANVRFGFEGFFSLFEKGYWETNSTNTLFNDMIVFPKTLETWLIGDGYAANPNMTDPYYIGPNFHGFYMGTDVGYLRFIFYFGIVGAFALILFICKTAWACMNRFPKYKMMFFLLLILNLVEWMKVSTDIFMVFALFLCLPQEDAETEDVIPEEQ